jgi:hypothetical protein
MDKGVLAFLWALGFFVFLWLGMRSVGIGNGTAFVLAAVTAFGIFFYVRIFGEERPR